METKYGLDTKYTTAPVQPVDQGFDARTLLSEGLSIVGGAIGAAAGLTVGAPHVGAAIGAGLGGGIGNLLEQQWIKGKVTDVPGAALEGGISALMAYGPIRAAKGVAGLASKGLKNVASYGLESAAATGARELASGTAGTVAQTAAQQGLKKLTGEKLAASSMLYRQGAGLYGAGTGISQTANLTKGASTGIGYNKFQQLVDFTEQKIGFSTGNATTLNAMAQDYARGVGRQIGAATADSVAKVSGKQLAKSATRALQDTALGDLSGTAVGQALISKIGKASTVDQLWNIRSGIIDKQLLSNAFGSTLAATKNYTAANTVRAVLNDAMTTAEKSLGGLFKDYTKAQQIIQLTNAVVKKTASSGIDIMGNKVLGGALQAGDVTLGRTLMQRGAAQTAKKLGTALPGAAAAGAGGAAGAAAAGVTAGMTKPQTVLYALQNMNPANVQRALIPSAVRQSAGQAIRGIVTGGAGAGGVSQEELSNVLGLGGDTTSTAGAGLTGLGMGGGTQRAQFNPYPIENLYYDLSRDPANASKYLAFYTNVQKAMSATGAGGMNVTKPTAEKYSNAVSGLASLDAYAKLLDANPNALSIGQRIPGQEGLPFGLSSDIQRMAGTTELNTLGYNMVENILRIRTGAAAPESEVRRYMQALLPQPGDSQIAIKNKLNTIAQTFMSIVNLANQGNTNTSALENALLNAGYSPYSTTTTGGA